MTALGALVPPPGHRLVRISDEPALWRPVNRLCMSVWPELMLHDAVDDQHWHLLDEVWLPFQLALVGPSGDIVAGAMASPLVWDGTDDGLPDGWDDQLVRAAADVAAGREPNTLGAIQICVAPDRRGEGLSALLLDAMRSVAAKARLRAVIACVRPTGKSRYPLMPIEAYAAWCRDDGLPADPWLRVHARAGGRIVRVSPRSMTISGTVAEFEAWTGLQFPVSGRYVVEGALVPVEVDLHADRGLYLDPNVWMVHSLE